MARTKAKSYHKHFRFKRVNGFFYVIYRTDPAHLKSTGIRVEEGEGAAVNRAYARLYIPQSSSITFGEFARDFFTPETCSWTQRMLKKGRTFSASYFAAHRGRLVTYILPQFGSIPLHMITTKLIDEWLMDLDSVFNGIPLSPASLDKLLAPISVTAALLQECEKTNEGYQKMKQYLEGQLRERLQTA